MQEKNSSHQFVVFGLQAQDYALPIESVHEIIHLVALTPVPEAPTWLPGLLNLRGRIIPVMDARLRLGLPAATPGLTTPIVITEVAARAVGLIVDKFAEWPALPAGAWALPTPLPG